MRRLFFGVRPSNQWARFAIAEFPLPQPPSAMSPTNVHLVCLPHIGRQGFAIPQVSLQSHGAGFAPQRLLYIGDLGHLQLGWTTAARSFLQACQTASFIALDPVGNGTGRIAQKGGDLAAV